LWFYKRRILKNTECFIKVTKNERAKKIQKILNELFPTTPIPLKHENTYTFLIAVLLSAQCTDERVNSVTPKLFAKANTPQMMVKVLVEDIEQIIKSLGLAPRKAKAIYGLSKILIESFDGEVPQTFEELESLPGVGHKTASVVMSQAFGKAAFPVDTHIHRCAKRWKLSNGKNVEQTEKDLKKLFNKDCWGKLHLQIIFFARLYCPARQHSSSDCPICCWS
jgi:endonuclease III